MEELLRELLEETRANGEKLDRLMERLDEVSDGYSLSEVHSVVTDMAGCYTLSEIYHKI